MQQYSDFLLQHFYHTSHQGRLDTNALDVYTATVGTPDNQDVLQLFVQIIDDKIKSATFLAKGSVAIIAGGQWLCDYIAQKNVSDLKQMTVEMILKNLGLPAVKVHVAGLLVQALQKCMDDYLNG